MFGALGYVKANQRLECFSCFVIVLLAQVKMVMKGETTKITINKNNKNI